MSDKVLPIDNTVMIICPEKGLSDEKIKALKDAAIKALQEKGYYIPLSTFTPSRGYLERNGTRSYSMHMLGLEVIRLASCDYVYFCKGYEKDPRCLILACIAREYGVKTVKLA